MFRRSSISGDISGILGRPEHSATVAVARPHYSTAPLKDALAANWRGWHLSEKMDGVFAVREFAGCVVAGESMRDGRFFVWDIATAFGSDIRRQPWTDRDQAIAELFSRLNPKLNWHRCASGSGAEFIESVLARGGEGVVAKRFHSGFDADWIKVKRVETFDCVVTEKHASKMSIRLALNGDDCGWCACLFSSFDSVSVGDVVEIAAYRRNANGKFREPRFIRTRPDK